LIGASFVAIAGVGGANPTIDAAGRPLPHRSTLNLIGRSVSCVDNKEASRTDCTIRSPNVYDVADYGARADGVADDTRAIQNALNACNAAGGGTVQLLPSRSKVTTTITLKSNCALIGAGMGVSIIAPVFSASPRNRVIDNDWVNGNSNILLRDFTIDRGGKNVQHGMLLNGINNLTIDRVEVTGFDSTTSGCLAISGVGPATRLISKNVRVTNSRFGNCDNFGVAVSYVLNAVIANNTFDDCYREAIGVEPEASCTAHGISITGNSFTTGTVPRGGSATGVIIITTTSGGKVDGVAVAGNTIRNTAPTVGNANPGIAVLGGTGVSLASNVVNGTNGPCISIGNASRGTSGVMIVANHLTGCGEGRLESFNQAGISLRRAMRCTLIGNYIEGSHDNASIYESQSGTTDNLIALNQLPESLLSPAVVLLAGSHTTLLSNASGFASSRITTATNYALKGNEELVGVTDTTAARTITLPTANTVAEGRPFVIKDESGGAGRNNITVKCSGTDTIEGTMSVRITRNYGSVMLYSDGLSKWFVR
jgi:hypothetical protein